MKKREDILHDFNDVLLAIGIVIIAGIIIAWRMVALLHYPEKLTKIKAERNKQAQELLLESEQ